MARSSPSRYARIMRPPGMSAGMRRLDGPDRSHVQRRTRAAFGHDADRAGTDDQRVGEHLHQHAHKRREERMMCGKPMAQKLVIAILEVGPDVEDLESGMLEQFD